MKNILILILTFTSLVFIGCEEQFTNIIEFDLPDHESKIVSYCFIENNDDSISVSISKSIGTLENNDNSIVKNAHIKLMKGETILTDLFVLDSSFSNTQRSIYKAKKPENIVPGQQYKLEVSSDNLPTIHGITTNYTQVKIDEIKYTKNGTTDLEGNKSDEIEISFYDPANEENYYIINGVIFYEYGNRGVVLESKDPRIQLSRGELIEISPNYTIGNYGKITYFSDADGLNGKLNKIKFFTNDIYPDNVSEKKIKIKIYKIPKEFYYFVTSSIRNSDFDIFSEPSDITKNMENGFGIFSMFSYDEKVIKL